MSLPFPALLAAMALPLLCAVAPATAAPDLLAPHRWRDRVLLVVAPSADDPALLRQRALFQALGADARARDLTLITTVGATVEAAALRRRFNLDEAFHVLLIGKDGGAKLTADAPVGAEALLPLIDAMPMRQQEMRRRP